MASAPSRKSFPRPPSPRLKVTPETQSADQNLQAGDSKAPAQSPLQSASLLGQPTEQALYRSPPSPAQQRTRPPAAQPAESYQPRKAAPEPLSADVWADHEADEDPDAAVDSPSALGSLLHLLLRAFVFAPSVAVYFVVSLLLCPLRVLEILVHRKGLCCWEKLPLYHFHRSCLRWLIFTLGIRVYVKGEWPQPARDAESRRAFLVAFNHTSALDGVFVAAYSPVSVSFVAKAETMYYPFVNALFFVYGVVFVNRSKRAVAIRSLKKAAADIKQSQRSIAISPEGTRSKNGRLATFKKGAFHLACDARIPILPVAIHGAFRLCPKNCLYPRTGSVVIQCAPVIPIDEEKLKDTEQDETSPESYRAQLARNLWDALSIMLGHTRAADLVHRPTLPDEKPSSHNAAPKSVRRVDVSSTHFTQDVAEPPFLSESNDTGDSSVFSARPDLTHTHSVAVKQIQMHPQSQQTKAVEPNQSPHGYKPITNSSSHKKTPFQLNIPTPFSRKTGLYPKASPRTPPSRSKAAFTQSPNAKESLPRDSQTKVNQTAFADTKVPALPSLPPLH